ncbi:MAG: DUF2284 domain-containing protein [Promethearchaeota archaeon]
MPAIEIKYNNIIFSPEVQRYCNNPKLKCPKYGHSWTCPPEAPYLEKEVSSYKKFYLIYSEFNLKEYMKKEKIMHPNLSEERIKNNLYRNNFLKDNLENEILSFLKNRELKFRRRFILWNGFCGICDNTKDKGCTYDNEKSCRYPNKKRYSMEAVGIHVSDTVKTLNINIEWPPVNYVYLFGLICFD